MRRRGIASAVAVCTVLLAVTACSTTTSRAPGASASAPSSSTAPLPPAPSATQRGHVITRSPMEVDPQGALSGVLVTRIVYRSTAGYAPGNPQGDFGTQVSGVIAVPDGQPPAGGWPIVAYGHGTTGAQTQCGPSRHPDLLGSASSIARLVKAGFVVAATDYQGLGVPGLPHPYLDARTAAYNMIDAVRAARDVVPHTSSRWAAAGESQGGQAAWAAAEWAGTEYGARLNFVGAATLAPAADVSPIAGKYIAKPYVPPVFSSVQMSYLPLLTAGLRAVYPSLPVDQYLHGELRAKADVFTDCGADSKFAKYSALTGLGEGDSRITAPALKSMHAKLAHNALPVRRAAGPIFVAYGTADQVVIPAWTEAAIRRACAIGDAMDVRVEPGRGHTNLVSGPASVEWLGERFAGKHSPNTCV